MTAKLTTLGGQICMWALDLEKLMSQCCIRQGRVASNPRTKLLLFLAGVGGQKSGLASRLVFDRTWSKQRFGRNNDALLKLKRSITC